MFCAVNLLNFKIVCGIGVLSVLVSCLACGQGPDAQKLSVAQPKLDIETVATIPLEERSKLLSALPAAEREKFFHRFLELPPGGPSNAKINALFMAWAAVDPNAAIENAKKLGTLDARRVAVEAICYGMKPAAAGAVVQSIKNFPDESVAPEQKERFLGIGLVKWSQSDPKAAAEFLSALYPDAGQRLIKPGEHDGELLTTTKGVAANWGATSPQAALAWFEKTWPQNPVALQSVIAGWWRKDAKAAAAYVRAHTNTPNEREVAGMISGAMAEQDPRVAVEWVEWMKDEKLRRRTRLAISEVWALRAPSEASAWAQQLSDKESGGVVGVVASVWTFSDAKAAEKWIDSLPDSKRDAAIRGYATTMARINPETALNRVVKMHDAKARITLTKAIASEWMKRGPEQTKAWIKKSKLAEAEKEKLLEGASLGD
jgi:hypothetical protein